MKKKPLFFKKKLTTLFSLIACICITLALFSFNKNKKELREILSTEKVSGVEKLYCFLMPKDSFDLLNGSSSGKKRMILEFSSSTLINTTPEFNLVAYLALSHKQHGEGSQSHYLKKLDTCYLTINKDEEYIFGNNYIRLKTLNSYIHNLTNPNYAYLKFIPKVDSNSKRHIYFMVIACDAGGGEIPQKPHLFTTPPPSTNPSPPASPGA